VVNLGAAAVSQMIRVIESLAIKGSYVTEVMWLEPKLVIRASSLPS